MARILAIDYGTKRVGLAITDPSQTIATALKTIHSKDVIAFLENYCQQESVELFVVGEPKQLNNQPSQSAKFVEAFINLLRKKFPQTPIKRIDERFTSKIASQTLAQSGMKKSKRQNKSLLDTISAVLILQSYLESQNRFYFDDKSP